MPTSSSTHTQHPTRQVLRSSVLCCIVATTWLIGASAAAAAPADPLRERGIVTQVLDGDTVLVDVDGRGTETRVRLTGINAPEIGACSAQPATDRLRALVEGRRVHLHAADARSTADGRPVRTVRLPRSDGSSTDINELLLREGHGVYFPLSNEVTNAVRYQIAAAEARAGGHGMWAPDACGRGPQPAHPIDVWVKWDADGDDTQNVNDEYVVIVNDHRSDTLELAGWVLSDSSLFTYTFPNTTTIAPGARLTVRVGRGTDTATELHMGRRDPLFDNIHSAPGVGDGAYLFDPRGNMRASFVYPCVIDCDTPLSGQLVIDHVTYDPPGVDTADTEWVRIRNVSNRRQSLDGVLLRVRVHAHEFEPRTFLDPGEQLTVVVGRGTSSRTLQYWGKTTPILRNSGDTAELVTFDERSIDCVDWGDQRCPSTGPPVPRERNSCDGPLYALVGDWNGSGRSGIGWWCNGSTRLRTADATTHDFVYGRSGDVPVVADWNGDGRDTVSVIRDGTWHVNDQLRGGAAARTFTYGRVARGDVPIAGSWDGRTRSLPGIIRDTQWHLRATQSGGPADHLFVYGRLSRGDRPLIGDWFGDGRDTIGIVRAGEWHLRDELAGGAATLSYVFGRVNAGDRPVVGDFNGDQRSTPAIVRSGQWFLKLTHGGGDADRVLSFPAP